MKHSLPALLLLTACAAADDGPCAEVEVPLGPADPTPLGASAEEIANQVEGDHAALLSRHEGTSALTLSVDWDPNSAAAWADRAPRQATLETGPMDGAASPVCASVLRLPVALTFRSADAAFDEVWTLDLEAKTPSDLHFTHRLEIRDLGGTWRPDTDGYTDTYIEVQGRFGPEGGTGEIRLVGEPGGGGAPETWSVGVWAPE
jgi:hypothetical protein